MTYDMRTLQDFLAGLTADELTQTRDLVSELLTNKQILQHVQPGKRPHIAMPERRGGDRYHIDVAGKGWDALKVRPTEADKCGVTMVDISANGCSLKTDTQFRPSQILSVECRTPTGLDQRIFVEVVRSRGVGTTRQAAFDIGCRTVDESHIARARQFLDHQKSLRARLDDHASIRVVQLAGDADCQAVFEWLRDQEYDIKSVKSPQEILPAVASHNASLVLTPASAIRSGATAWLDDLRNSFPKTCVVSLAGTIEDCGRVKALGVEQSVIVSKVSAQVRLALERAFCRQVSDLRDALKKIPVKLMIAGRDEKHMRRLETLLLGRNYLISKCPAPEELQHELQMQKYDLLIAAGEIFSENRFDDIAELRRHYPALVIIIDTDDPEQAQEALGKDADLTLRTSATRAELMDCIEKANQALLLRTFVH